MRLLSKEVDKRLITQLDRTIKNHNGVDGIMTFGQMNDYPQTIERLVFGSVSAKSCRNIYARFLIGQGFENELINNIIVGQKNGKNITLLSLLGDVCKSVALNNGAYIHVNKTRENKVVNSKITPFKYCRFGKIDDRGFYSKIAVYENWQKDRDNIRGVGYSYKASDVKWFPVYTENETAFAAQVNDLSKGNIESFPGQIYFFALDTEYLYPLSPFDPVYLDCDTDQQVSIYMNNQTRNGFSTKTLMRVPGFSNEADEKEFNDSVKGWIGTEGDNIIVLQDEFDEQGNIKGEGAFKIDKIESSINDKLFEAWQKSLANNIRKSVQNLPAILIDYEENKLGSTSGEAIVQATNFYNAMTLNDRNEISKAIQEIFSNSTNEVLASNTNWNIKPLNLYNNDSVINVQPAASN